MDTAEEIAHQIVDQGGRATALQADVLSKESLHRLAQQTLEAFGSIDILINGAGGAKKEATTSQTLSFFDLPEDAVRWVFDLNFMGTFLACQVVGRQMVEQDHGRILNIASMGAYRPLTRSVAYSAAKAAVVNFTQWLAVHFAQEYTPQIRVNALVPGFFLTEQNRFLLVDEQNGGLTDRGQRILDHTPVERFGHPEDLIAPALLLLSDNAPFVHGTTVVVDGGLSAYGGV
jgi:NAD(P)-dependent dehydrogenase (short-subunit alcohol dehydrogenase family)